MCAYTQFRGTHSERTRGLIMVPQSSRWKRNCRAPGRCQSQWQRKDFRKDLVQHYSSARAGQISGCSHVPLS